MGVIYWLYNPQTGSAFDLDKGGYWLTREFEPGYQFREDEDETDELRPAVSSDDLGESTDIITQYAQHRLPLHGRADSAYLSYVVDQWVRWRRANPGPLVLCNDSGTDERGRVTNADGEYEEFPAGVCMGTGYDPDPRRRR